MENNIKIRFQRVFPGFILDVSFSAPALGVTAVFGPSGSGKTTLLRCIAGLEHTPDGIINLNGEIWQDNSVFIPVHRRSLGYVFQEPGLFSHLTVRQNLEYGFKRIRSSEKKINFHHVVELLNLEDLLLRKDPSNLSGGEKQRIAIGRAILTSPKLLLMDEPLSSLDSRNKLEILPYIQKLNRELKIPVIYVSHSMDEVTRLADYIVLLENGRVIASGPLQKILTRLDLPTARTDETGTVIETSIASQDEIYHLTCLDFPGGSLWVGKVDQPTGSSVRARILARDVSISVEKSLNSSIINILPARILELQDDGHDRVMIRLATGDNQIILSRITRRSRDQLGLIPEMNVFAQVKSVALII